MRTIDGNALYSWLGDTMLPKCMIDRSKDAEDTVLEVMQRVREMKEADGYGPHMAPSDGTEPLGVMADKNKPHPLLKKMLEWCCFALTISSIFFAFLFAIAAMAVFINALTDGQGIQNIIIPTLVSILFGLLASVFWSFRQHISEEV